MIKTINAPINLYICIHSFPDTNSTHAHRLGAEGGGPQEHVLPRQRRQHAGELQHAQLDDGVLLRAHPFPRGAVVVGAHLGVVVMVVVGVV